MCNIFLYDYKYFSLQKPINFINNIKFSYVMAFDKSLDKEIFGETIEFETTRIRVSVFSYNSGTPKLQLSRENRNLESGEFIFSKLGRLTKEESEKVLEVFSKAIQNM
jgi:hypothetical protein